MSLRGVGSVAAVECARLRAQGRAQVVLACCAAGPWLFALVMRIQHSLPEDTLFGRALLDSGFALPLFILGFAGLWLFPVLAAIVAGDLFSGEDRHGTWAMVLTRGRSRMEIYTGKVAIALAFAALAVAALGASSLGAGLVVVGNGPVVDLSGALLPPGRAVARVGLAWASVLPPTCGFTALAVLVSIATRSSAAGTGLPVLTALVMQLAGLVDGPAGIRRVLLTSAFGAWHGLVQEHPFHGPLIDGLIVSGAVGAACLAAGYRLFARRDIGR